MSKKLDRAANLNSFFNELKTELSAWMEETGTKQAVLASMLGVNSSQVSHAVRPNGQMSENFIRKLSDTVPQFHGVYPRFYELRYNTALPASADAIADARKRRAKVIDDLLQAKRDLRDALDAFTDAAIEAVRRG